MPPQAKPQDPLIGTRLDQRYLVTGTLGRGGMGVVYEGVHEQLGRAVAIKVLGAAIAAEEVVVKRFLREARIAAGLGHGNIVDVSDLGTLPDGRPYLVMPKIDGISFGKLLEQRGPQSPSRVVELLQGVASALDLVHAKGLVHRDVKPENLMYVVRADGSETVMLMDFGIATLVASGAARLTAEGVVCGTPAYLAPESARGEEADHRADVYALATVAFELLTGGLPFDAENQLRILPMKAFRDPPRLATVATRTFPEAIEEVIARGLSRDPDMRYRGAGEFVTSLELAVEQGELPRSAATVSLGAVPAPLGAVPPPIGAPASMGSISESPTSSLPVRPRGPSESLEMPLGASDEFALDALESEVAVDRAAREAQRAEAAPSSRPPPAPQRRGPLMAAVAIALALGAAAVVLFASGGDAPEKPPARVQRDPVAGPPAKAAASTTPSPAVPEAKVAAAPVEVAPPPVRPPVTGPAAAPSEPEPGAAPERGRTKRSQPRASARPAPRESEAAALPRVALPTAEELLREASQTLLRGQLSRAAELYEAATQRDPRSAAAFRGLGLTSERLGNKSAAIRAYKRSLELAPSGPQADSVRDRLAKLK